MPVISQESLTLISNFVKDGRIKEFLRFSIHDESEIERKVNTVASPELEKHLTDLLKKYNIKRNSPTTWYIMCCLIDRTPSLW